MLFQSILIHSLTHSHSVVNLIFELITHWLVLQIQRSDTVASIVVEDLKTSAVW